MSLEKKNGISEQILSLGLFSLSDFVSGGRLQKAKVSAVNHQWRINCERTASIRRLLADSIHHGEQQKSVKCVFDVCDAKVFSLSTHLRLTITWIIVIQGGLLHVHIAVKRIQGCQNSLSTCTSATQQDRLKCPHCCPVTKTKKPRFQGFLTIILRAVPGSNKFSGSRV